MVIITWLDQDNNNYPHSMVIPMKEDLLKQELREALLAAFNACIKEGDR